MLLFSQDGLIIVINPHVMGNQLSHIVAVQTKPDTELPDLLNQCIIVLEPTPDDKSESSNSMEVKPVPLENILVEQSEIELMSFL
jgi:hypothetical protein